MWQRGPTRLTGTICSASWSCAAGCLSARQCLTLAAGWAGPCPEVASLYQELPAGGWPGAELGRDSEGQLSASWPEADWGHPAGGQGVQGSLEAELGQAVEGQEFEG